MYQRFEGHDDRKFFHHVFNARREHSGLGKDFKPLNLFLDAARWHGGTTSARAQLDREQFQKACDAKDHKYKLPRYVRNYLRQLETMIEADLVETPTRPRFARNQRFFNDEASATRTAYA